jgi:hypothetical protein
MALPNAGVPLSLNDIATEFSSLSPTQPHSLSEFYGADDGVPASGEISINDFYGTSFAVPIGATGGTIVDSGGYRYHIFNSSGTFNVSSGALGSYSDTIEVAAQGGGGAGGKNGGGGGGGGCFVQGTTTGAAKIGSNPVSIGSAGTRVIGGDYTFVEATSTSGLGVTGQQGGRGGAIFAGLAATASGGGSSYSYQQPGAGLPGGNRGGYVFGGNQGAPTGGGGGAGAAGGDRNVNIGQYGGGPGGAGVQSVILHGGTPAYSGGGGGGAAQPAGAGGIGGGGSGGSEVTGSGSTWGGGGGGSSSRRTYGGNGYQGRWACRYEYGE